RHDLLPGRGERHVVRCALDELQAERLLELLQLRREGRLADEAARGGPPEVAQLRHRHEIAQVLELQLHGTRYTESIEFIKSIDWNDSRPDAMMGAVTGPIPAPHPRRVPVHARRRSSLSAVC